MIRKPYCMICLAAAMMAVSCAGHRGFTTVAADGGFAGKCMISGAGMSVRNDGEFPYMRLTADSALFSPCVGFSAEDTGYDSLMCDSVRFIAVKVRAGKDLRGDRMVLTCICDSTEASAQSTGNFRGHWEWYAFDMTGQPGFRGRILGVKYEFIDRMDAGNVLDFAGIGFFRSQEELEMCCAARRSGPAVREGIRQSPRKECESAEVYDMSGCALDAGAGCSEAARRISGVFEEVYGASPAEGNPNSGRIVLRLAGGAADWSVSLDGGSRTVSIRGGSGPALMQAVRAFLTYVCAADSLRPTASSRMECAAERTDNSELLEYVSTDRVKLVPSDPAGELMTPEWFGSLVMVEMCPPKASIGGTLPQSRRLLDFYASVGVNAIWLTPIYDSRVGCNGYASHGPHTVDPMFSGTDDQAKGWEAVRDFVSYAHSKGIYVFFDVVTWGAMRTSALVSGHPDWFSGDAWGHRAYDWSNPELREWFVSTLVENIMKTDADGYRCDCEPYYTGYGVFRDIRERLAAKGKHVALISEDGSTRRSSFECEQDGVLNYSAMDRVGLYRHPANFFTEGYLDVVNSVKTGEGLGIACGQNNPLWRGTGRYYTNCITNHDYWGRNVLGNRLKIGYSAILAPFIPIWYMGDEFLTEAESADVIYNDRVDYSEAAKPENALLLEDVKRMIRIRRTYGGILEDWPMNHRDCRICPVKTEGLGTLRGYARYSRDGAVLVIPNSSGGSSVGTVTVPFRECGLSGFGCYRITDLMTGRVLLTGGADEVSPFKAAVDVNHAGVYLVEVE